MITTETPLPPVKLALVIDGAVVDILHTDDRLGAILLSTPTIVDVTGVDNNVICNVGDTYDPATNTFSPSVFIQAPLNG